MWYAAERPGHDNIIQAAWASLRVEDDYLTGSWLLYESRWAQMASIAGGIGPTAWTENLVESNVNSPNAMADTYPFPGRQRWADDSVYHMQGLGLMTNIGEAIDRSATYETAQNLAPARVIADGNFLAIKK
jgi:hypothetical protein